MKHVEDMTLYLKDIIFFYESSEEGSVSMNVSVLFQLKIQPKC